MFLTRSEYDRGVNTFSPEGRLFQVRQIAPVGIALGYGLDDRGSRARFPVAAGNFSLHHCVQNGSGAHPVSYPVGVPGALSLAVKRPWREADHSPPSSAEVKEWVDLYLRFPIRLHGVFLS
jgi:hypothetical protein